jgi:hypothetical protein
LKTFEEKKRKLSDTDLTEENENKRQKIEGEEDNSNEGDSDSEDNQDEVQNGHENVEQKQQKAVTTFLNFLEAFPFNWNNAPVQELFTVEEENGNASNNNNNKS